MLGGPKEVFRGLCFTPKLPPNHFLTANVKWCYFCDSSPGKQWVIQWNQASRTSLVVCLQNLFVAIPPITNYPSNDHSQ